MSITKQDIIEVLEAAKNSGELAFILEYDATENIEEIRVLQDEKSIDSWIEFIQENYEDCSDDEGDFIFLLYSMDMQIKDATFGSYRELRNTFGW